MANEFENSDYPQTPASQGRRVFWGLFGFAVTLKDTATDAVRGVFLNTFALTLKYLYNQNKKNVIFDNMESQKSNLFILLFLIVLSSCTTKQTPVDAQGRPLIIRSGTIDVDLVETTPIVFNGKVYRYEYVRKGYWGNDTGDSYFRFVDIETGKPTKSFAKGFHLGSAYVHDETVYVTGVDVWDGEQIHVFASKDLEDWDHWLAFELPGFGIFNTSMTRDEEGFVLMFEIGKPEDRAGERFTANFAKSKDMKQWEVLSSNHNYSKDRYTAPHCLRYHKGYYYNFYLEAHDGYEMRVVRSKDLIQWETSPLNSVLKASEEDKQIANNSLSKKLQKEIANAKNINNSDLDFCEFNGKLVINYSWGNQRGEEFLAEAYYQGTMAQFLEGWFPTGE